VLVDTDQGITGTGETVLKRKDRLIEAGVHELERFLIGRDPTQIEDLWEKMYRDSFWVGGPQQTTPSAQSRFALWDILGQSLGSDLPSAGGPTRSRIPLYCHCPAGATPDELAANAAACVRRGYRGLESDPAPFLRSTEECPSGWRGGRCTLWLFGDLGEIRPQPQGDRTAPPDLFQRIRAFFVAARGRLARRST
jgi:galactonate dehydratase